ncbi:MAG: threonylcarbamoyl-AMP synthase [Oscillospiraceae bacterium]|nr:threonylcarbamoyl-AMP synthase [Oscillospiraceae bacterium]
MGYDTRLLPYSRESAAEAADLLSRRQIVAIPTETVYGLAANALDEWGVKNIFRAKGRPQDNPLIVHIASMKMLTPLVKEIPDIAKELAERFWGGPLTMIFPKSDKVPSVTSGGLDTVAVRMPSSEAALDIIRRCGFPLAAPSANLSGKPSPTTAQHVFEDMNGKIPLIIDGGECTVGVESTVICFKSGKIHILRPGGVTAEMLSEFGEVEVDKAVTAQPDRDERVLSPGMKYKHYSPKADVYIINAHGEKFVDYCTKRGRYEKKLLALGAGVSEQGIFLDYGATAEVQAQRLFSLLRRADELGADTVLVEAPKQNGMGLAVYNRLLRAAAFRVIEV